MISALSQGARRLGGGKCDICSVYIRCNTHAYIRHEIDAYIRCPYRHTCIRCLAAAAAGNHGDCTVLLGISATEQQRCWQRCGT